MIFLLQFCSLVKLIGVLVYNNGDVEIVCRMSHVLAESSCLDLHQLMYTAVHAVMSSRRLVKLIKVCSVVTQL